MRIRNIDIEHPIVLAPMEDVTDQPFRVICKRLGADIVYTEFVNSEGLIRDSVKAKVKLQFKEEERPFGIQIYGGEEASMESAARIAESANPDLIDINCGCWVKDVALRGAGAGLLRDLPKMERVVSSVVKSVGLPVTVKTRLGWDSESIRITDVARMLEQTGVQALTIHCRTRAQGHKGEPDFSWIPRVKAAVHIPVFVNGSIDTLEKVKQAFDETGCDGVMVGRVAIDNPWFFQQAKHYLRTLQQPPTPSLDERLSVTLQHLALAVEYKGERRGVIEFRKHYSGYLKGLPHASKVRQDLMQYVEQQPVVEKISAYFESLKQLEPLEVLA
ncbi:MAG: tRNA dihydrouridine synthase DusB [Ignavibacteriae bacterium]|nr:tRNA dihydrouridine synthase DusB [Ignavibacteriota bacterium]